MASTMVLQLFLHDWYNPHREPMTTGTVHYQFRSVSWNMDRLVVGNTYQYPQA